MQIFIPLALVKLEIYSILLKIFYLLPATLLQVELVQRKISVQLLGSVSLEAAIMMQKRHL